MMSIFTIYPKLPLLKQRKRIREMSQEIRELLESIKVVPAEDDSEGNTCCKMKVNDYKKIFQVLTLLKQQPPAGEMTKMICLNLDNWEESLLKDTKDIRIVEIIKWLKVVCERLDRAEAISKIKDERIANFEAMIKIKDELIFAYESVNAPINPLLKINKDLLRASIYAHILLTENIGQSTHAIAMLEVAIAKAKE